MSFVLDVYRATEMFPKSELYGLVSQLRRAAVSVPSNIAEGQGRAFDKEFGHFLSNPLGSLMEAETQILIAQSLHFLDDGTANRLLKQAAEIGRILNGLILAVRKSAARSKREEKA